MNPSAHRANARAALRGNWAIAVLAAFLVDLLSGEGTALNIVISPKTMPPVWFSVPTRLQLILDDILGLPQKVVFGFSLVMLLGGLLLGGVLRLGSARYSLNLVDGRKAKLGDIFSGAPRFSEALVMHLLSTPLTFLGFLLFVIPGAMLHCGFAMAPYVLAEDPAYTGREALRRSWEMMRGHKLECLRLELFFFGWLLLGASTFGIAALFLAPYRNAAYASFYRELSRSPER